MIAILHNIRSLHNVGSIFRTADAAGVEKIYLTGITPSPIDEFGHSRPQLTKVALGGEKFVLWESVRRAGVLIDRLKKEGYQIFAIEQSPNSISYNKLTPCEGVRISLILGNEIKGLPLAILKKCDKILEIPMYGKKESLNVAVAFGVVVFGLKINGSK